MSILSSNLYALLWDLLKSLLRQNRPSRHCACDQALVLLTSEPVCVKYETCQQECSLANFFFRQLFWTIVAENTNYHLGRYMLNMHHPNQLTATCRTWKAGVHLHCRSYPWKRWNYQARTALMAECMPKYSFWPPGDSSLTFIRGVTTITQLILLIWLYWFSCCACLDWRRKAFHTKNIKATACLCKYEWSWKLTIPWNPDAWYVAHEFAVKACLPEMSVTKLDNWAASGICILAGMWLGKEECIPWWLVCSFHAESCHRRRRREKKLTLTLASVKPNRVAKLITS